MFKRFLNNSSLRDLDIGQRRDLLICTGGPHMEDLIVYNAKVVTEPIPAVPAVQAVVADPANGIEAEVVPTAWDTGIQMCMDAIKCNMNELMARQTLFTGMPSSN